jgi:hypothetical protein
VSLVVSLAQIASVALDRHGPDDLGVDACGHSDAIDVLVGQR